MATSPGGMQALMAQLLNGGGQMQALPPTGSGQPQAAPQSSTPMMSNLDEVDAYDRNTKISIRGSQRMLTREALREVVPFLGQFFFNGQFVSALSQVGKTVDYAEFWRMIEDATGIGKRYVAIRDLNPQEKQALQQPTPQIQAQMQMKQQDAQTRLQLMDKKTQSEQSIADKQGEWEALKAQETSATAILKLIQEEKAALNSGQEERQGAHADMMMEIQAKQQELQHEREKHQMDLQHKKQSMAFDMQASQQKHEQAMSQNAQKAIMARILGGAEQRQAGTSRLESKSRPVAPRPGY